MIGRRLGQYQIAEKLSEGGMGVVCKARDEHLDRSIVVKVLPAKKLADHDRTGSETVPGFWGHGFEGLEIARTPYGNSPVFPAAYRQGWPSGLSLLPLQTSQNRPLISADEQHILFERAEVDYSDRKYIRTSDNRIILIRSRHPFHALTLYTSHAGLEFPMRISLRYPKCQRYWLEMKGENKVVLTNPRRKLP